MNHLELLAEMERLVESGDQAGLEIFVIEHFKELPPDVQGKVLMGFVSAALEEREGAPSIEDLQEEGLAALEQIAAVRQEIAQTSLAS